MVTSRLRPAILWFALPLATIYAAAFYVAGKLPSVDHPDALAVGLTLDLTVLVPGLYYVVLVRRHGWPAFSTAAVFLLSVLAASWVVPPTHQSLLRLIQFAVPAVELTVVGYIFVKAYRTFRRAQPARGDGDAYDRLRRITRSALDVPSAAGVLAYELAVFYYAFAPGRPARQVEGEGAFSYHRKSGYGAVLAALLMAAALELTAGHFLLRQWSATAVWIHLGLSLYGVLWLIGDYRAQRQRPIRLDRDRLRLCCGIRWDVEVPWHQVRSIERKPSFRTWSGRKDVLNLHVLGRPHFLIELERPVRAEGPYGVGRDVLKIGFNVDDPERFAERLSRFFPNAAIS